MSDNIAVKCFPLAGEQDYQVEDFQNYLGMRTSGVLASATCLQVSQSAVPAMEVSVAAGIAWLTVGSYSGVSFPIRTTKVLDIDPSDPINDRVDSIVCGINKTTGIGYLKVSKGAWAGSAPVPVRNATYYEIVIAHVSVPANTTEIIDALITDKRSDATVCGIVSDGATIVDDTQSEPAIGVLSADMFRAAEGTYDARPATCAVLTFYFATDTQTLCIYSPTLGGWIEK